jgi:DNA-binding transcriptional regulator YdaS (Cro superfamily)
MDRETAYDKGIADGGGLTKLAEIMGESLQTLNNWRSRGVPPGKCKAFAAATGVSVKLLRPNDWARYWPELIASEIDA